MSGYVGLSVDWIEEWGQFVQPCNWRTFHAVLIEFEDDQMMGGVEATLVILGLGFRVRWNYRKTEAVEEIERRVAELDLSGAQAEGEGR